jgi:aldose 1-epimerase
VTTSSVIELKRGPLTLVLAPEIGGSIASFTFRGQDMMRPGGRALLEEGMVRAAGCFPLVPFSGRIADARFTFEGEVVELEPNFPPEPHAIHGQGWENPWQVRHENEHLVELVFTYQRSSTMLHYEASQIFRLEDDALEIELAVKNTGKGRMPAGLGLHPYFVRTPGATLQTRLSHMWLADERNIPRERVELPEHVDFTQPQKVADHEHDHGFDGFDGRAQIVWPETGHRLTMKASDAFDHLVIYIPSGKNYFCVEPATHANNGFNMLPEEAQDGAGSPDEDTESVDSGVEILDPGASLGGRVRFEVA